MLRDEHRISCARGFDGLHPLIGVDAGRIENLWVRGTVTPFAIKKCIGAEVDDDAEFEVLPCSLLW